MKKLLILLVVLCPFAAKAQSAFNFDYDYARFGYDSTSNYVEFYYSFAQSQLKLVKKDAGFVVNALLHIEITDTARKVSVVKKDFNIVNPVTDTSKAGMSRSLVGVIGFIVPRGQYKSVVTGQDVADPAKKKEIVEHLKIEPLVRNTLAMSDIELASNIKQENTDSTSIFYKNTLEVQPNPTMIFGDGVPVLFHYAEVYNLAKDTVLRKEIKISTVLYNSKGNKLINKVKKMNLLSNSRVDVGAINISKYPTDTYTLIVAMIDTVHNYGVQSAKKFFVYNPTVADTFKSAAAKGDVLSSEFSVLTSEECDQFFEKSKYIATANEIAQYERMESAEAKRDFLFQFWKKRDQDRSTAVNEFKDQYMEKVRESNEKYGTINRQGMKTDRGRVLIIYGEPDEIERYPNDLDKKPYEVWHYNQIEGGVIFIFGDLSGFGDYQLLNSTKRGELRDDNWLRRIQTAN